MRQPLYIHAATAISPQQSFEAEHFLKPQITSDNNRLYALDAPYAQYISPVAIRRMSRIMKMTISAAMQCLTDAGIKTPDAIITGTGRGGVTDMEMFVKDMIRLNEEALNPTTFIQSTYNSPNGWIAMQSGCTGYNQTYVHRGCSFEFALLDAQMLLAEARRPLNILVGCYDEMTEEYYLIRSKRGYWKEEIINSANLVQYSDSSGTIGGEGTAFFVLSNESEGSTACIDTVHILHNANSERLTNAVNEILEEANMTANDLSLVLMGLNGDVVQSNLYSDILAGLPKAVPIATFKHLVGEYDTATGFGLWLINQLLFDKITLNRMLSKNDLNVSSSFSKILFINHFILGTASIMLISA